jgi:hypothetical protein
MKLHLEFTVPELNDSGDEEAEAVRVIKRVQGRLARYGFPQFGEKIEARDTNGNTIGHWWVEQQ